MSRCFPFPPPGYEKKIRTVEADSLIKEKQKKKKKRKKEKKGKEKREGKEKKDKETNSNKEGKERKEKHRDRKDKEKSTTSSQENKKAVGVLSNTVQNNGNEESKFVQELARRINDEEEARESQSVGKCSFPCGVTENFAMEERSENAVLRRVSSWRDQKGTEIMIQPVEKKEDAKKTELQEKSHLRESVTKGEPKLFNCYAENGSRLNKIHRPVVASPVSSVENGSKLGACQTPPKPVTELQGTVCNPKVKEHRVNGFTAISSVEVKENGGASVKKRPHSDLKYLDEILNVPKGEDLQEVGEEDEEQEWLFGQSGVELLSKKPKTDSGTSLDEETLQVWNQALRIESADTIALPYVVPF